VKENLFIYNFIIILVAGLGLITDIKNAPTMFMPFAISSYSILYLQKHQSESSSSWNKVEATMPVKKRSVILSKYMSFLIFIGIGCLIAGSYIVVFNILTSVMIWEKYLINLFLLVIGSMISSGAFLYPIVLTLGERENSTGLILAFICAGTSLYLISKIARRFLELGSVLELSEYLPFFLVYLGVSVIVFIVSYFISVRIYEKNEY
jgi:hypothetical protein